MKNNNLFQNHMFKLKLEAIVKSVLCGCAVGFGANFIVALVTWFTEFNGFWLALGVFALVSAVSGVLFYFLRFYPSELRNAKRVDGIGLQERLITMLEYQNDDSYMAKVQRADAKRALASVAKEHIKLNISKAIIITVSVCFSLGVPMTTVNGLSQYGSLPGGNELFESTVGDAIAAHYEVIYKVSETGGGSINGGDGQLAEEFELFIKEGNDGTPVTAVADDGFYFVKWSDGCTDATRTDKNITEDAEYYAEFAEVGGYVFEDYDEGDAPSDAPKESSDGGSAGDGEGSGDGAGGKETAGKYDPKNQIVNGNTYYRQDIELYKDDANERILDENSGLTEAEIELIKKYLGIV